MTNPQGTKWETEIVTYVNDVGIPAVRLVKQGQKDEADVLLGNRFSARWSIPVVAWKRLASKKEGQKQRQPLGERRMVIMGFSEFVYLLTLLEDWDLPAVYVQAKWTERLSVSKTLDGLRKWLNAKVSP